MAGKALEELLLKIGIVDQVTGQAKGIVKSINKITQTAKDGMKSIGKGALIVGGVTASIFGLSHAGRDMNKALGEVGSLSVANSELNKLQHSAMAFTDEFGGTASQVVRSAYDIQSAINGLDNGELAKFTYNSALLAKGTKSDAATITDYMGTMYGVFEKDAQAIGKAEWVDQLTGKTAQAVKMFKTTGSEMAAAFSGLGSTAKTMGVDINEQMAILGQLQTTMSGSEAATKYTAFISGAGKAAKALGMNFTDSNGHLLPMVDILEKIKSKVGDVSKMSLADSDALKDAFGRKEAVHLIKDLLPNIEKLKGNIDEIGKTTGLDKVKEMAGSMTDPFDRMIARSKNLFTVFSQDFIETLKPLFSLINKGLKTFQTWMGKFPALRKILVGVTIAVLALTAAVGTFMIAMGVVKLIMSAVATFKLLVTTLKALELAQIKANIAMLANPVGLVIVAIVALVAAVAALVVYWEDLVNWFKNSSPFIKIGVLLLLLMSPVTALAVGIAALIYYWSDLVAWFKDTTFGKAVVATFNLIGAVLGAAWEMIKNVYYFLSGDFNSISFDALGGAIDALVGWFGSLWDFIISIPEGIWNAIKAIFMGIYNFIGSIITGIKDWFVGLINYLPQLAQKAINVLRKIPLIGKLFGDEKEQKLRVEKRSEMRMDVPALAAGRKMDLPAGGISSNNKSTTFGDVYIDAPNGLNRSQMEEWSLMQA